MEVRVVGFVSALAYSSNCLILSSASASYRFKSSGCSSGPEEALSSPGCEFCLLGVGELLLLAATTKS